MASRRLRLQKLLHKEVVDSTGRPAGRIKEVRARVRSGQCVVEAYMLGSEGLLDRLSVANLSLAVLRFAGATTRTGGKKVPWDLMDLADPDHPKLKCTLEQLDAMQPLG